MIPDAEQVVGAFLRTHDPIVALAARVVGTTPDDTSAPWVRLTQLDAGDEAGSGVEHLIGFFLQFDCYAGKTGGQAQASLLAGTVRAALASMPDQDLATVVVSRVRFTTHARLPDIDFEPSRERFVLDAIVQMHAKS